MKPSPFSLPDTSGLTPLSLPDIVLRKGAAPDDAVAVPSAMPSAESISRFERAMSGGAASPDIHRTILRVTAPVDAATSRQTPSDDVTPALPRIFQAFARDAVATPSVHPMIAEETAPLQETASLPKATPLTEETPISGHQDPVIPSAGGAQVHSAQTNAEPPRHIPAAVVVDSPRPAPAPASIIPDAPQQVQTPAAPTTSKIEGSEVAQRNPITVDIPKTDAVPANVVRDSAIPVEVPKIEVPKTGAIPVDVPQRDVAPQRVPAAVVVDLPRPAPAPTSFIPDAPQQVQAPAAPATSKIEGSEVAQRNPITVDIPKTDAIPVNVPQGDAAPQHIPAAAVTDAAGVPSPAAPTPATTTVDAAPLRVVKTEPGRTQQLQTVDSAFLNVAQPQAAPGAATPVTIEIDPSEASARTAQLVEVAEAVADTILVTPALVRGEGKVTIRLKPTVLDGSEIHLEAKGTKITVTIAPTTDAAQQIVEQSKAQLAQTLVQRLPSFQFAVMISPRLMTDRKGPSDETT